MSLAVGVHASKRRNTLCHVDSKEKAARRNTITCPTPQPSPSPSNAQKPEHFDVADRRRRHLRRRRRLSPHQAVPGHELRRPRGAGKLRRHVAHAPLSRHPLRQRPLHLRLSLQAVDRRADRDRGGDPGLHGRGDRGERPRPAHPLRPQDRLGRLVERGQSLDASRPRAPTPARRCASRPTSCGCARATTGTPRATRPSGRAWTTFKGRIVHPQTWPEDLDYKGKNVVVIGSGATAATLIPAMAGDCGHVTMLQRSPTYFIPGAQRQRPRRHAARAADRRDLDPRDRAPQDPARSGRLHPPLVR